MFGEAAISMDLIQQICGRMFCEAIVLDGFIPGCVTGLSVMRYLFKASIRCLCFHPVSVSPTDVQVNIFLSPVSSRFVDGGLSVSP
jgi:hypothetical protein